MGEFLFVPHAGARLYLLPGFEFVEWNNTFLQPQRRAKTICTVGSADAKDVEAPHMLGIIRPRQKDVNIK